MIKTFRCIVVAGLSFGLSGCWTVHLVVNPDIPKVSSIGAGKKMILGSFEDARVNVASGMNSGQDFLYKEGAETATLTVAPEDTLKDSIGTSFGDAGFEVMKDGSTTDGNQIQVSGKFRKQDYNHNGRNFVVGTG